MIPRSLPRQSSLIATTTVLGAASLQPKNIAAGKDPQPMSGEHAAEFWLNAAAHPDHAEIFARQEERARKEQRNTILLAAGADQPSEDAGQSVDAV